MLIIPKYRLSAAGGDGRIRAVVTAKGNDGPRQGRQRVDPAWDASYACKWRLTMLCAGYTKVWDLAAGELVRLDGARGTTLRVTRGTLWLTLENDTRDIVLTAGDSYTIDRGGLTLIEAQGASSVCVLARYVDAVRHPAVAAPRRRRLAAWLASRLAPDDMGGYSPYY
jgi:hypothetical protein